MFLKASDADGPPTWPGILESANGSASVAYAGDQPVLGARGGAAFTVLRRPRLPFLRARPETLAPGEGRVPCPPLRKGDRVRLELDGSSHTWTYDPDGNLGLPGRVAMSCARLGSGVAFACLLGWILTDIGTNARSLFYGGTAARTPLATAIREQPYALYPPRPQVRSPFLDAAAKAGKGGTGEGFVARWKAENPIPAPSSHDIRTEETTR